MKQPTDKCSVISLPKRYLVKKSKGICGNIHPGGSSTHRGPNEANNSPKIISLPAHIGGVVRHETPLAERKPGGKYLPMLRKRCSCKAATSLETPPVPFPTPTSAVDTFSSINLECLYCSDSSTSDEVHRSV